MHLAALTSLFGSFAHQAAPMAVTGLWQGMAVAFALALCLKFAPRVSAAHRFALWAAAFLAAAALPLLPPAVSSHSAYAFASQLAQPAPSAHIWLELDSRWTLAIAALWLVASAARFVDLVLHSLRLGHLWRTAVPVQPLAFPKLARTMEVCSTQWLDRPSVIGFFAPRILIPDWLLPRLTAGELSQIVLHESTHLARRDDWTNLLQKLCLVFFPLSPALWWIDRRLAKEREMACDEAVVSITQAPRAYAACLTSLVERGLEHRGPYGHAFIHEENRRAEALSLGAWQRRSEIVDRVHRILRGHRSLHPIAARVLIGALGCGLLATSFALARCPQLVAFVAPKPASASSDVQTAELGDLVYPTDSHRNTFMHGVRIVQAKAVVPAAPQTKPRASRARFEAAPKKGPAVGELRPASSEPASHTAQNELALTAVNQPARQSTAVPEQFVVFTTWERVETSASSTQIIADYNTDPAAGSNLTAETAANPAAQGATQTSPNSPKPTSRFTVTRLIFRVVPTNSQTGSKPGPGSNSKPAQPMAIPIGDGWFVIQL